MTLNDSRRPSPSCRPEVVASSIPGRHVRLRVAGDGRQGRGLMLPSGVVIRGETARPAMQGRNSSH